MTIKNEFDQPIGFSLANWQPCQHLPKESLGGQFCTVEPIDIEKHGRSHYIEVGHINFAPPLQQTPAATEAMYLLMKNVFDTLDYRRYEWKSNQTR